MLRARRDLPAERPHRCRDVSRRSSTDALVGRRLDLEDGATVATGSVRRRTQIAEIVRISIF